jgi:LmbE family N-acetylglucosaminyl deacetylase
VSEQSSNKVAMVIVAHPDDAEFACAGTVALWAREGWDVSYVICTDGGSGGPDEATDVSAAQRNIVIETRKQEQRAACAVLGAQDVLFLGYPDGQLRPTLELRRDIVRLLRRYRPARVICQSPDRIWSPSYSLGRHHPDHLAAGQATLEAIYPASQNPWDFPELLAEGLLPHKVAEVYVAAPPVVNFHVDITTTMDQKLAALRAHASQISEEAYAKIEQWQRSMSATMGERYGVTYAEEYHLIKNR